MIHAWFWIVACLYNSASSSSWILPAKIRRHPQTDCCQLAYRDDTDNDVVGQDCNRQNWSSKQKFSSVLLILDCHESMQLVIISNASRSVKECLSLEIKNRYNDLHVVPCRDCHIIMPAADTPAKMPRPIHILLLSSHSPQLSSSSSSSASGRSLGTLWTEGDFEATLVFRCNKAKFHLTCFDVLPS